MEENILIPLTRNKSAMVSLCDYYRVAQFKWCATPAGSGLWYAVRGIARNGKRTTQGMHRFILGIEDQRQVDHADGNGLNNTRLNIREATSSLNNHRRKMIKSRSGFYGVTKHALSERWFANIHAEGRTLYLGLFRSPETAAEAYDRAALKIYGDKARTNFQHQKTRQGWKRLL